jgi:hypothetical protein
MLDPGNVIQLPPSDWRTEIECGAPFSRKNPVQRAAKARPGVVLLVKEKINRFKSIA